MLQKSIKINYSKLIETVTVTFNYEYVEGSKPTTISCNFQNCNLNLDTNKNVSGNFYSISENNVFQLLTTTIPLVITELNYIMDNYENPEVTTSGSTVSNS